jgi:hypothetical protein
MTHMSSLTLSSYTRYTRKRGNVHVPWNRILRSLRGCLKISRHFMCALMWWRSEYWQEATSDRHCTSFLSAPEVWPFCFSKVSWSEEHKQNKCPILSCRDTLWLSIFPILFPRNNTTSYFSTVFISLFFLHKRCVHGGHDETFLRLGK